MIALFGFLRLMGFIWGVALIAVIFVLYWHGDTTQSSCDYDCKHCPFPKCSDEDIARWKEFDRLNGTYRRK